MRPRYCATMHSQRLLRGMARYDSAQSGKVGFALYLPTGIHRQLGCAFQPHSVPRGIVCQRIIQCHLQLGTHCANKYRHRLGQYYFFAPIVASGRRYQFRDSLWQVEVLEADDATLHTSPNPPCFQAEDLFRNRQSRKRKDYRNNSPSQLGGTDYHCHR